MRHILQTTANPHIWEECDQFVFDNRDTVVRDGDKRRYTGNYVKISDDGIETSVKNCDAKVFGTLARMLGGGKFRRFGTNNSRRISARTGIR